MKIREVKIWEIKGRRVIVSVPVLCGRPGCLLEGGGHSRGAAGGGAGARS